MSCEVTVRTNTMLRCVFVLSAAMAFDCNKHSPCFGENGGKYFPVPDPHKYIQCANYGGCFIMDCPGQLVWNKDVSTCM